MSLTMQLALLPDEATAQTMELLQDLHKEMPTATFQKVVHICLGMVSRGPEKHDPITFSLVGMLLGAVLDIATKEVTWEKALLQLPPQLLANYQLAYSRLPPEIRMLIDAVCNTPNEEPAPTGTKH